MCYGRVDIVGWKPIPDKWANHLEYDHEGLDQFLQELEATLPKTVYAHRIAGHINDAIFAQKALEIFDDWRAKGLVP